MNVIQFFSKLSEQSDFTLSHLLDSYPFSTARVITSHVSLQNVAFFPVDSSCVMRISQKHPIAPGTGKPDGCGSSWPLSSHM